ncbi:MULTISPECIES: ParA family protein [Microbacterium]|jgi:chromosome partitioning protein|uniref:ParA family protein n=2 Tax=Microbacteriaceae TaxID=85023 RepID=A0ABT5SL69_9MICO|nr:MULTISPECIES: ParA family protein [Microbacterium]MDD7963585.1 ParA family protein [Microbacterium thalli]MDN8549543.1 ParA family protein [Microbacterium thalli]
MQTVMVYSEAGGVSKTTAAVSVAMTSAEAGHRTVLIDLDPRAASTKWTRTEPVGEGLHVGAILGAKEEPTGWAQDLAVPSRWHELLRVIPSARDLSNRESERDDYAELRLKASLVDLDADVVVIDCANRQGGPLTLSALHASDRVLYAATASDSGIDGVTGAKRTVEAFRRSMARLGAATGIEEAGVTMTRDGTGFLSYAEQDAIDQVRELAPIIEPIVPHLAIVPEVRMAGEWYGAYRKGTPVREAYSEVMRKVIR